MGNTIEEIASVIETITNTTTPQASAGVLIEFFMNLFGNIATSSNPVAAAQTHADTIAAHKDALAAAVAANP